MADTKISGLAAGTPKATDLYVAVDTTDSSMAPTGTDKKYTRSGDAAYVVSTITLAGDVTGALGANVIGTNVVTNAKSAQMAANTIKGNNAGSTANAVDLTVSQVKTELAYGTMADQNANAVDIIGGTINGTSIGNIIPLDISATSITETTFTTVGIVHNSVGGLFSTGLIVNADVDSAAAIVDTKLATISTAGKVSNSATTATASNTPSTIVLRDGSGNFAAGTITATLSGTATNFSGALSGDVTGTQSATSIPANSITNAKLAQMASNTFKGNNTLSLGNPVDLTITQAKTMLGIVASVSVAPTQIGFGDVSSNLVGSASLTWDGSTLSVIGGAKISGLSTTGIVHNSSAGVLSTSLIVNADITNATITGAKIAANTVANSNLSQMGALTFKANNTGSTANAADISVSAAQTLLGLSGSLTIGNTQIGFGDSSGNLIGNSNITWNDTNKVLSLVGGSEINLGVTTSSRKVVLYSATTNAFQYYGFGVAGGAQEYTVDAVASDHVFYAGLTTTTRQELFRIKGNKTVVTQSGGGIQFGNATASYSPATLNYYEGAVTVTMSLSGPWASPVSFPVTFYRLGNLVTMQWVGMSSGVARTVSSTITSSPTSNNIPARFGTSALSGFTKPIRIIDGSTSASADVGAIAFSNGAGGLFITITPAANVPFSNAFCGVPFGEITWQFA
jgi:hypothetical protein